MGKVKYATGIEYVQGSLAKPTVKAGHVHGTYLSLRRSVGRKQPVIWGPRKF